MNTSRLQYASEWDLYSISEVSLLFSTKPIGCHLADTALQLSTGGQLFYNEFFKKPVSPGAQQKVFLLDLEDAERMQQGGFEKAFPNLTEFCKTYPLKSIYLRCFSSDAVSKKLVVFAEEVLEIIPLLLVQMGELDRQMEKLKEYECKWKVTKGYRIIDLDELKVALDDFKVNKDILTIVPDIHYFHTIHLDTPLSLGICSPGVYSPDKKMVVSVSGAVFTIFREIVTLVDWSYFRSMKLFAAESFRKLLISHMKTLVTYHENSYVLESEVEALVEELIESCVEFQEVVTPHIIFRKCDFNDTMTFDGFMDVVKFSRLPNYRTFHPSKEEAKNGELPMWKVQILLLFDWSDMFFDKDSRDLKQLVLQGIQHLVPLSRWESEEDLMNVILCKDPLKQERAVELMEYNASVIENIKLEGYSVKHEKNIFQIKRCRRWVHRDIIRSRIAQENPDASKIQELINNAREDMAQNYKKNKESTEKKLAIGMKLLNEFIVKVRGNECEKQKVAKTELMNNMSKTWTHLEGQIREVLSGKSNKVVSLKMNGKSSKNPISLTVDDEETHSSKKWEEEKKEMMGRIQNLEKTVKQAEIKEAKNKDKMEKTWKRKMEAKEKKWAEEKKALKEKLAAKERKVVEIKMALDSEVLKNQELQKQLKDQLKTASSPPKVKMVAQVKIRLEQLQSCRNRLISENHASNATKKIFELKSLTKDPKIKQGAELEQLNFNIAHEKYLKAVDKSIQLIRNNPGIKLNEIPALPPFPALCDGFERAYAKAMEQRDMERAGPSTSSSSASSRSSEDCAICLEEMEESEHLHKCENCNRNFHAVCVSDWLFKKSTCPMCRRHMVDPEEFPELH